MSVEFFKTRLIASALFWYFSAPMLAAIPDSLTQQSDEEKVVLLNSLSRRYNADSTDFAIELAKEALTIAVRLNDSRQRAIALVNLAEGHLYNDLYDMALQYDLEALDIFNQLPNKEDIALVLMSLGWIYFDIQDGENALIYHQRALEILQSSKDTVRLAAALNAVGLAHSLNKDHKAALPYFEKSLKLGNAVNNFERMTASLNNIGDIQIELGNYKKADSILGRSLYYAASLKDVFRSAEVQNSMAHSLLKQHKYAEAEKHLLEAKTLIAQSRSNAGKEFLLGNALVGSQLYEEMGKHEEALRYLKLYNEIHQQILSDAKKVGIAQKKFEIELKKTMLQIDQLKRERELRISQRNGIAIAIIILSVLGFLAYSRERQIRIKESQLAEAHEALLRGDLQRSDLERQLLSNKLEYKTSEMTNFALHLSQRNELLNNFLEELNLIKSTVNPETSAQIAKMVKRFSDKEEINKETENFHLSIETEYKDFLFNLLKQFPDLTENEKRLCAQVRLNLSIKDIASINNISVKSVEMARYRLRKKFNLDHEANLTDFLKKF